MKIAIFGGAFNPVHIEHVNIAKSAISQLSLDKLIVMPTFISPHKKDKLVASFESRMEMCRLAFSSIPQAEVSDYEMLQGGVSYSYKTCEYFRSLYPNDEIYFLIGADMLQLFPKWKEPERILQCVDIAACARENAEEYLSYERDFYSHFNKYPVKINYVGEKVSSTRIRVLASLGEDISKYVLPNVCQYIKDNELYLMKDLLKVKDYLTKERWEHSVRVAIMCAENCAKAGITEQKAIVMSALHDVAKYMTKDSAELKNFEFPEGVPSPVLHQFSGAYVAANTFNVDDEDLLNAIRYHTSGRENMSPTEVLLYLSDMLEEGRDFKNVDALRTVFKADMEICMLTSLKHQVEYLATTGKPVYALTQKAYEYYKEKYKNEQ